MTPANMTPTLTVAGGDSTRSYFTLAWLDEMPRCVKAMKIVYRQSIKTALALVELTSPALYQAAISIIVGGWKEKHHLACDVHLCVIDHFD